MATESNNQDELTLQAFYLRGDPGRFTEIMSADAMRPAAESRELREQTINTSIGGFQLPGRILPAGRWWEYYAHSAIHAACVDAKARDIVGGGFEITPGKQAVSAALIEHMTAFVEDHLEALNDACRDWEATGWAALELLPTRSGNELAALNHLDSWTVYPTKGGAGYIHMRDSRYVHYTNLGDKQPGAYQIAFLNNNHWYKNTYYGAPDIISAIIQIESAYEALKHNQEFFARRGGYRWLMTIESSGGLPGAESAQGDAKLVQKINYEVKQSGKNSDTDLLIIPLGSRKATLTKLDADMKDLDFAGLLERYGDDILMRHGVPPLRAGIVRTGQLGGSVGQDQLRSYNDNIVRPKQRRWGRFISSILRAWWDVDVTLTFTGLEFDEFNSMAYPISNLFSNLVINRREARELISLPDVDGGIDTFFDDLMPCVGGTPFDANAVPAKP